MKAFVKLFNDSPLQPLKRTTFKMSKLLSTMDASSKQNSYSNIPYTKCHTRIIDFKSIGISSHATDARYRQIYQKYVATNTTNACLLRTAISSVTHGIAPPVAFPTETVYGLGADATNSAAVAGIFAAKGRPSDNPLIVHVSSIEHLERLTGDLPKVYRPVAEKFWPGPLTILLPVPNPSPFAENVHPGQKTIGFRIPASKYARFFIAACDRPIAGPSANSSGRPSPTTAWHVKNDLDGKIEFILDGGACDVGVESTVIDGMCDPPTILRPGGVSLQEFRKLGGVWAKTVNGFETHNSLEVQPSNGNGVGVNGHAIEPDPGAAPRAPGMKYKHYSPAAKLILFTPTAIANGRVRQRHKSLEGASGKTRKMRISFLDRTWGKYGGMTLTDTTSSMQNGESEGEPQQNGHMAPFRSDTGSKTAAALGIDSIELQWQPFTTSTTSIELPDRTVFDLPLPSSIEGTKAATNGVLKDRRLEDLATHLFAILRYFDALECDYIFMESVEHNSGGAGDVVDAVKDRLDKAAYERVEE
jgi:tRNA threonylcarbamoyl adenosine modification protein (Sua5/YciO/YrdC/YwlC family)